MFALSGKALEKSQQRAKKELSENPAHNAAHCESLRRWISSMPHLSCPTDDEFLLKFLRVAKFNHSKAEQRLDNFCTSRSSDEISKKWFQYPSVDSPIIDKVLNIKMHLPCGVTEEGEVLLLFNMEKWDVDKVHVDELMVFGYMMFDYLLSFPAVQITGISMLQDLTGATLKKMTVWSEDHDRMKAMMRVWQDASPTRTKSIVYYKEPAIFDFFFKIFSFWMKPKIKKRIHRIGDNLSKANEAIRGSKKILPKEYGGTNGTVDELHARFVKEFKEFHRGNNNIFTNIKVDESKRPESAKNFMAKYADLPSELSKETRGTYTKFDV